MRCPLRFTLFAGWCLALAPLQAREPSSPIAQAIAPFLANHDVAGAVTLVARDGKVVHLEAHGLARLRPARSMQTDDLFWIASMSKPIAGIAVLMLQDEGRLSVEDPVEKHLPEFKDLWLLAEDSPDRRVLRRPARAITIRDLLTHTAGVPNVEEPRPHTTLGELVAEISQQPLSFEPGSQWSYSNSGINTLGRIVEVVSGERFQDFVQERLFRPLGMKNTTFFPNRSQARRVAGSYEKKEDQLAETDVYFVRGDLWDTARTVKPAGGLFSTAEDMFRLYQMLLDDGICRGRRYLSPAAVRELTRTQTGDLKTGFTDGMSWGLAFQVVKHPEGVTAMLSPGTFGHGGAYGTQSWADPKTGAIYILMIQRRGFPNGDKSAIREAFQRAAARFPAGADPRNPLSLRDAQDR